MQMNVRRNQTAVAFFKVLLPQLEMYFSGIPLACLNKIKCSRPYQLNGDIMI